MKLIPSTLLEQLVADEAQATPLFTLRETKEIIFSLLTKRQKNAGLGRSILYHLKRFGRCDQHSHPGFVNHEKIYFRCESHPFGYTITLEGDRYAAAKRIFHEHQRRAAIKATRALRAQRRFGRTGVIIPLFKMPKPFRPRNLAGANGRLKQHFKQTVLSFGQVVEAIAYTSRQRVPTVFRRLTESLDGRPVATLRLRGGFVFRVDFVGNNGLQRFISTSARVTLHSSNDNEHHAYRRLRSKLRQLLGTTSKARRREHQRYHKMRQTLRQSMRYAS